MTKLVDKQTLIKKSKEGIFQGYNQRKITALKEYIKENHDLIKSKQRGIEEYIIKEIQNDPHPDYAHEIIDNFIDDLLKYDRTFIEYFLNSSFIMSYSIFESSFEYVCSYAQKSKPTKLKTSDLNGKGIERCRNFIQKVIEIDLSPYNTEWEEIKKYSKVRNLIIHSSSDLKTSDSQSYKSHELLPFLLKNSYVQFKTARKGEFYIKDPAFIFDFLNTSGSFLNKIMHKINEV